MTRNRDFYFIFLWGWRRLNLFLLPKMSDVNLLARIVDLRSAPSALTASHMKKVEREKILISIVNRKSRAIET